MPLILVGIPTEEILLEVLVDREEGMFQSSSSKWRRAAAAHTSLLHERRIEMRQKTNG